MKIGVPKERASGERRVAVTPETVRRLVAAGFAVKVERDAGTDASIPDREYEAAGAELEAEAARLYETSQLIVKVRAPLADEMVRIQPGTQLIALLYPLLYPELVRELAERKTTSFAMDMIPRIARAQKMDALSSQNNIAGYKAVILAADAAGKLMPLLMTAAGTIQPARVFVIGAGVAGLQAVATAKRLGARVVAFDTRPGVKGQVESLGAIFLSMPLAERETQDEQGYAKELSEESQRKEMALIAEHAAGSDIVITTALIPGKPAPRLILEETVRAMKPGSVIVDLAADFGGNCVLTEPGKEVARHGVKVIGHTNVPSLMAEEASRLYARNVMHFLLEVFKNGGRNFDMKDEVVRQTLVTLEGEVVHPRIREITECEESA